MSEGNVLDTQIQGSLGQVMGMINNMEKQTASLMDSAKPKRKSKTLESGETVDLINIAHVCKYNFLGIFPTKKLVVTYKSGLKITVTANLNEIKI